MLGRHHLRAKVLQALYANESSSEKERIRQNYLQRSIESIFDLYTTIFSLLLALRSRAKAKQEVKKESQVSDPLSIEELEAFIDNKILNLLIANRELQEHLGKNNQLVWSQNDPLVSALFDEIQKSTLYKEYVGKESRSMGADKKFLVRIFQDYIVVNETLAENLEDKNIYWANDLSMANSMVKATVESFTKKSDESFQLFKVYKNLDDRDFVEMLFSRTLDSNTELENEIRNRSENWDIERISKIDKLLLKMALCEIKYFPSIPAVVSVNEYVELSKDYSTPKSRVFINGILDRVIKESS